MQAASKAEAGRRSQQPIFEFTSVYTRSQPFYTMSEEEAIEHNTFPSFIQGMAPKEENIQYHIGPYKVLRDIGKGGMGEVLLAYDPKCGRRVAIKKIRPDLMQHIVLRKRFLKEARITSQLTHPAIMPIYAIEDKEDIVYYTMPFVQGQTLKQILRKTREQEKKGEPLHHIGGSILALIRIFITVCQAIAYAHSKGVLHRDLKPENIMVGEYGEILILDWGLAKLLHSSAKEEECDLPFEAKDHHTRPGKIVGTLNFMAPERAQGGIATVQTEIYSLGVILYQLLTLRNPFQRATLEEFKEKMAKETIADPASLAPYRDVPRVLSQLCLKCLAKKPEDRFQTVDELLREVENYIEGRSEWFHAATLHIAKKEDWEFQENVLIAEHTAITRAADVSDWVSLMISQASFTGNTKIEAEITIGENGSGIGLLLSVSEAAERTHLNDGYCLWLGSDKNPTTKLLRSTVEVIDAPEVYLKRKTAYKIRVEKIEHNIHFYLNDTLQFSYISHLPQVGTHVGLLSRDADFHIENFSVFVGSQNITVNCLAVPDAFLAHNDYKTALNEYRRIGYSFPGRAEGREAMFRAGVTLLEEAKKQEDPLQKEALYDEAFQEFEKLHATPGAPLEYLGKALVYQAMGDITEEIKCYELGFRKYPLHPLLPVLREQLIFRMHETSRLDRISAYQFMLCSLHHLPEAFAGTHTKKLFQSLQKHWEPLPFIEQIPESSTSEKVKNLELRTTLAFWLSNPHALSEVFDDAMTEDAPRFPLLANVLFCFLELGLWQIAQKKLEEHPLPFTSRDIELVQIAACCHQESPKKAMEAFFREQPDLLHKRDLRTLYHILACAIEKEEHFAVEEMMKRINKADLSWEDEQSLNSCYLWSLLLQSRWEEAGQLFQEYPFALLTKDSSLLFTLYGCWLAATENPEIAEIHFSGTLDVSFPRTWTLLSYYLNGRISEEGRWGKSAFTWEKKQLYRQLYLYYHCTGNLALKKKYRKMALKTSS